MEDAEVERQQGEDAGDEAGVQPPVLGERKEQDVG
jgi:hypothetical protein